MIGASNLDFDLQRAFGPVRFRGNLGHFAAVFFFRIGLWTDGAALAQPHFRKIDFVHIHFDLQIGEIRDGDQRGARSAAAAEGLGSDEFVGVDEFVEDDAIDWGANGTPVEVRFEEDPIGTDLLELRLSVGFRKPGVVEHFLHFNPTGHEFVRTFEIGKGAVDGDLGDDRLSIVFAQTRLVLRVIQPDDDLSVGDGVAFLNPDPSNNS